MTKRTIKQWQQIMQAHKEFAGTTKQFCVERNIAVQTFYSRRHAMGLERQVSGQTLSCCCVFSFSNNVTCPLCSMRSDKNFNRRDLPECKTN